MKSANAVKLWKTDILDLKEKNFLTYIRGKFHSEISGSDLNKSGKSEPQMQDYEEIRLVLHSTSDLFRISSIICKITRHAKKVAPNYLM